MKTKTIRRSMITLTMAAVLLTGCGGGGGADGKPEAAAPTDNGVASLPPNEALERATTAAKNAKSYRIKGNIDNDGKKMTLDFRVTGADLGGRLSMDEASLELLAVAGQQYIRPDEQFWVQTAGADAADDVMKLMGDKWAKVSDTDKDFSEMFGVANIDELLKPDGTLTRGEAKDIDGIKTIGLVDGDKSGTLYVATTGEPYPIRLEGGQGATGQITFSDFGATFDDVQAPPADQVVDFDQLKRR